LKVIFTDSTNLPSLFQINPSGATWLNVPALVTETFLGAVSITAFAVLSTTIFQSIVPDVKVNENQSFASLFDAEISISQLITLFHSTATFTLG
jgi:hypothetical protein